MVDKSVKGEWTFIRLSGEVTDQELRDTVENLWSSPTLNVRAEIAPGAFRNITTETINYIASLAGTYGHKRKGGRTELIAPTDLEYGLVRMFEMLAEARGAAFAVHPKRS